MLHFDFVTKERLLNGKNNMHNFYVGKSERNMNMTIKERRACAVGYGERTTAENTQSHPFRSVLRLPAMRAL